MPVPQVDLVIKHKEFGQWRLSFEEAVELVRKTCDAMGYHYNRLHIEDVPGIDLTFPFENQGEPGDTITVQVEDLL